LPELRLMADHFNQVIAKADTMVGETGLEDCECMDLLSCSVVLAQMGMTVVPTEDRWLNITWDRGGDCGVPADYYVVEFRAIVPDTFALVEMGNNIGGIGFRVYGTTGYSDPQLMSVPSEPFYEEGEFLFFGLDYSTPALSDCSQ
jgi:hypothetical protein